MISFNQKNPRQVLNNHISVCMAASYSGYDMQYIRRLLRIGKLVGIKIGQMWLVDKGALENYIECQGPFFHTNDKYFDNVTLTICSSFGLTPQARLTRASSVDKMTHNQAGGLFW